jgi:carboxymethylenebutenolidase
VGISGRAFESIKASSTPANAICAQLSELPARDTPPAVVLATESSPDVTPLDGVQASNVSFTHGEGFLAKPTKSVDNMLGVVVLQEWWGLNDNIKDITMRFAQEGFAALAPDLYHGVVVSEPDEARKIVMEFDMPQAIREIQQAMAYLQGLEAVGGAGVGLVGFCMGGRLVLQTSRMGNGLGAGIAFYGSPLSDQEASEVKAPIMGLYGSEDHGIPLDAVQGMGEALSELGIVHEIQVYEGAGHAFFNDTRQSFHPEAAADAWQRTLGWLRTHLGKEPGNF